MISNELLNNPVSFIHRLSETQELNLSIDSVVKSASGLVSKIILNNPDKINSAALVDALKDVEVIESIEIRGSETGQICVTVKDSVETIEVDEGKGGVSSNRLKTSGIISCTAVGFSIDGINCLAHYNHPTRDVQIPGETVTFYLEEIKSRFTPSQLKSAIYYIYYNDTDVDNENDHDETSLDNALRFLDELEIPDDHVVLGKVGPLDTVYQPPK